MPGSLTKKQERMWKQAKAYVAKSKGTSVRSLAGRDWGLVQNIFQAMKKKYAGRVPSYYAKAESRIFEATESYSGFSLALYEMRMARAAKSLYEGVKNLALRGHLFRDIEGVEPGMKDVARMKDILTKSGGDERKMMMYVRNMAKAIGDISKAQRRAAAALKILPKEIAMDAAQEFMSKF